MRKKIFYSILGGVIVLGIVWVSLLFVSFKKTDPIYGASFDPEYAGYLGVDPLAVFTTIVEKWNLKHIRFPLHWDKLEKTPGQFDFSEADQYLKEADRMGAKLILAVGNKTPRWPECHIPAWAKNLTEQEYHKALRNYIRVSVERYKNHPALEMWQVENEPFLFYGDCFKITPEEFKEEIELVKTVDPRHPVLTADSGELSSWVHTSKGGDFFGTTLYRVVWNKYIGYWSYDWLPAAFYRTKLWLVDRKPSTAFVVELQAESWAPDKAIYETPIEEQNKSMSLDRLKKNVNYAEKLGFSRVYLWGAEWWYWLELKGYKEIPEYVRTLNN